jgi:RNA polymerase sigma-70 factor (ECF subfamily)
MNRQQQLTNEFLASRHGLYGFIYGLVRNTHDAEDVLQEVWLRFFNAVAEGVEIQDQAKWCRGTARNLILHYWRDRRDDKVIVDQELLDLAELAYTEQDRNSPYWSMREQALRECMDGLPERFKHLLRLKYCMGLSAEAVAEELRQSVAATFKTLSRVRQALRECAQKKLDLQRV